MSMVYVIRPLDQYMKDLFDHYNEAYPDTASRMPNRDDISKVIARFGVENSILSHLYVEPGTSFVGKDIWIYSKFFENSVSVLEYEEKDNQGNGPFMTFVGGYMDIVGPVVKELSRVCGPLIVLFEAPGEIITPETDLAPIFDYIREAKNRYS